jgi:hypothetical protein
LRPEVAPPALRAPSPAKPPGTLPLGIALVALGIAVLVDWLGVVDLPWQVLLPVTLLALGAAHLVGARHDRHGGLTVLGMGIMIALAVSDVVEVGLADRLTGR